MKDGHVIDRRRERIAIVLAEIEAWANEVDRRSAGQYLQLFAGSRYEGQEQLYIHNHPVKLINDALRRRVVSMLVNCLPTERPQRREPYP